MGKLLISKSGYELQEIELEHGTVSIGRAKDNDIQLNDATVSSHHAKIVTVMSTSYIQDLGSTNGIFVNGDPVVVQALHADDVIAIGNHEIVFQQKNVSHSTQDEDVYDTQLVNSIAGSGSSHSHQKSVSSEKVFTDFRDTIGYSDLGQANPGLRVVVDNTTGPAEQHALDIDINIDRFLGDKPKRDKAPTNIVTENKRSESERPYTQTYPYVEVPVTAKINSNESKVEKIEEDLLAAETLSVEQPIKRESRTSTSEIENYGERLAKKPEATKSLHSKQPFMSPEEVVEQLIEMSRSKSKRAKKSSGLSSVLGIFTFLLIAVAIYYQLQ